MADRFWVGSSGNWSDAANHWSDSSGGTPNASFLPTANDDVYFDAASNGAGTGAFTVTVDGTSGSPSLCASFLTGGAGGALDGAMTLTMGATARLNCNGSMTLPATSLSVSGTTGALITFVSTTSQTLTTNGVSLGNVSVTVDGVAGTLTLGSALTCSTLTVTNGTFDTSASNYNVTAVALSSSNSNTRTIKLNGSTVTLSGASPVDFTTATNLTFTAGTSTINCSNLNPGFVGGGQTFYNVSFTNSTYSAMTVSGSNTFNNLTFTSPSATGLRTVALFANQTVNGTLTIGASSSAIRRIRIASDSLGVRRTITLNGTLATLADVDFRDIKVAGTVATPWTGTRLGDCKNNSGITFDTPKTVYWNLSGSQNWAATGWATTNNGVPDVNNFPLAQDTATFTEAGAAGTISYTLNWAIGSLQMADGVSNRTTAFTLAAGTNLPQIYGNLTLFSNLTLTGTGAFQFLGQGITQTLTSAGLTLTQPITINSPGGTVQLQDNLTVDSARYTTLTSGTLNLNNNTLTTGFFESVNSNARSIAFGTTGNITVTANAATVFDILTATNFTYTGTSNINSTYSGSTGTRTIRIGYTGASVASAMNVNVSAGSDTITLTGYWKNVDFTGFTGALNNSGTGRNISGNLTFSTGMTLNAGTAATVFDGVSGIQQITTSGKTLDFPVTFNGVGGTFQLQDNMTVGSTRTVTLTNGTLDLTGNSGNWTLSTGLFVSGNSNTRAIAFGTGNITLTGNNATILSMTTLTGFTYTGTPTVNATYSGATGTRTFSVGNTAGGTEANAFNINISAGTDIVGLAGVCKNVDFTGFSGTLNFNTRSIYGNLTISSGMTLAAGTAVTTFAGTSGTQTITTNGKTLDFPITFNGIGGTFAFADALTQGSTRAFTITNGTVQLKNGVTSTVGSFATSGTNQKFLQSTLAGSQATLSQASGTVNASYLTIKDINATGGATWNAYFINNNVDAGNNTGWNFTDSPSNVAEFGMRLRSFTEPRRF